MQRLFSTFPRGWPGFGLLILRITVGLSSILGGIAGPGSSPKFDPGALPGLASAGLLLVGAWTPVTGTLLAFTHLERSIEQPGRLESCLVMVALGTSLAMLGPGAWSIDALLFGRKRIDIPKP